MIRSRTSFVLIGALSAAFAAGTTHIVVTGDTLWDITGAYLGDPFQWPTVWQNNPQIADAHWIYPGDTVHLEARNGGEAPPAAQANEPQPASNQPYSAADDPLSEFPLDPSLQKVVMKAADPLATLATPPTQSVLNQDAMRVAPVHYGKSEAPESMQSQLNWDFEGSRHMIRPGTTVGVSMGSDKGIQVGAILEIIETNEKVVTFVDAKVEGRYEQIRGLCKVVEAMSDSSICLFDRVYGNAGLNSFARVHNPLPEVVVTGFEPVDATDPARVIANTRNSRIQMPGNYVIIDRGREASVREGDIYEFMASSQRRGMAAMRGHGIVVRTTQNSATVFLVGVAQKPILIGDRAWLIRKAVKSG